MSSHELAHRDQRPVMDDGIPTPVSYNRTSCSPISDSLLRVPAYSLNHILVLAPFRLLGRHPPQATCLLRGLCQIGRDNAANGK